MPLYYGIAKEDAKEDEIVEVAKKILAVLDQHVLPCQWDNPDIGKAIFVRLDLHMPIQRASDDDGQDDDHRSRSISTKNEDTEDFCWNESWRKREEADSYYFYQKNDNH